MKKDTNKFGFSEFEKTHIIELLSKKLSAISFNSREEARTASDTFLGATIRTLYFSERIYNLFSQLSLVEDGITKIDEKTIIFPGNCLKTGDMIPGKKYVLHFFRELDTKNRDKGSVYSKTYQELMENGHSDMPKPAIHLTFEEFEALSKTFDVKLFVAYGGILTLSNKLAGKKLYLDMYQGPQLLREKGSAICTLFICVTEAENGITM